MTRTPFFLACVLALAMSCGARALAISEFCPAELGAAHVVKDGGGTLVSTTLNAEGPRTVTADAEVQTENGWYTFSIPATTIVEQEAKYANSILTFTRNESSSPVVYVRFPQNAGKVLNWWITDAQSSGDTVMGWDAKGKVQCGPYAHPIGSAPSNGSRQLEAFNAKRLSPPLPDLDRMPGPGDSVLDVAVTTAERFACDKPFANSSVMHAVAPQWPQGYSTPVQLETLVRVDVSTDGSVADAWVWQPSGVRAFDLAAVAAARQSTYAAGRAYCVAAPGRYIFRALFNP